MEIGAFLIIVPEGRILAFLMVVSRQDRNSLSLLEALLFIGVLHFSRNGANWSYVAIVSSTVILKRPKRIAMSL